jgi:thiamine-phosphate pyrophosphorylase
MGCDPLAAVVELARAGLPAFQWREKDLGAGETFGLLKGLDGALRASGAGTSLLVNDRVDVALALGIGVHLPENALPTRIVRALVPPGTLVGRSTHAIEAIQRARSEGADYALFGPIFDTPSKRAYGAPLGPEALRAAVRAAGGFPILAVGGITVERAAACLEAGAHGVAVIGAIWDTPDRVAACRGFLAVAERASPPRSPGPAAP